MEFTIEAAFTRKVDTSYFAGTALDGYSQLGDKITMTGRETPQFDFGDSRLINKLTMDVVSYSVRENWVMGQWKVRHSYATPNNGGNPWLARFTGCCRYSELLNNADKPWELIAQVDLNRQKASPRVSVLPMVSVPREPVGQVPKVVLPATIWDVGSETPKTMAMDWKVQNPFDVGNAAMFRGGAYMSLDLQPFFTDAARKCCTNKAFCTNHLAKFAANPSVAPGCLARLLTTDYQDVPYGAGAGDQQSLSPAMTIEGWVKIASEEGGYVLSTGRPAGAPACHNKGSCQVALIFIKINATHVTVGHERFDESLQAHAESVSFAISSSEALVQQLSDSGFYAQSAGSTGPSLVDKFVHVMVVRKSLVGPSMDNGLHEVGGNSYREDWFSTYKVYVNGFMLEVATYPFCAAGAVCTNGARFGGFSRAEFVSKLGCYATDDVAARDTSGNDGCKVELTLGESNPLLGPRRPTAHPTPSDLTADDASGRCKRNAVEKMCEDNFGNETALLFGAYRGAVFAESYFNGTLDEWRFWNGERSRADLLNSYRRPLTPGMSNNYGDPTKVPGSSGENGRISGSNYETSTVLMALYSFDRSKAEALDEDCAIDGCLFSKMRPTFPEASDPPDASDDFWLATAGCGLGTLCPAGSTGGVRYAPTDATGVMFYKGGSLYKVDPPGSGEPTVGRIAFPGRPRAGLYQVTIQVSANDASPTVPVDFIVELLDSVYEQNQIAYKLNPQTNPMYAINQYIPKLEFAAPVQRKMDANGMAFVEFVGSEQLVNPEQAGWTQFDNYVYPHKARAFAGFMVEVKIKGSDKQGISYAAPNEDPQDEHWKDTKVGFTIGPSPDSAVFTTVKNTNPSEMDMTWTPCASELGNNVLCMDAVDYHFDRQRSLASPDPSKDFLDRSASSNMRCLHFEVVEDPAPKFAGGIPTELTLTIGRPSTVELVAWDDNCLDEVTIDVQAGSQLPAGAVLEKQNKKTGIGRTCTNDGAQSGESRTLRWTPHTKMGGFNGSSCFEVSDTGGAKSCGNAPQVTRHCIHFKVQRCRYALQEDQQLQEVAALFNVDWMRLWSLNLNLTHPDYVVYKKQVIMVGHLYRVAPNDRMDRISQRLGMSVSQLRDLNYDIGNDDTLATGQELCVVPNSCKGEKETFYSGMVYRDDKFFAAAKTGQ